MFRRGLLLTMIVALPLALSGEAHARASNTDNANTPGVAPSPEVMPEPPPPPPVPVYRKPPPKKQPKPALPPNRKPAVQAPAAQTPAAQTPAPQSAQPAAPTSESGDVGTSWKLIRNAFGMMVSDTKAMGFYNCRDGTPCLIVIATTPIPPGAVSTQVPVKIIVDGEPFLTLTATVTKDSLHFEDPRLADLEQRLLTARSMRVESAYARREASLTGLAEPLSTLQAERSRLAGKNSPAAKTSASALAQVVKQSSDNADLQAQIALLGRLLDEQNKALADSAGDDAQGKEVLQQTLAVIRTRIDKLSAAYEDGVKAFNTSLSSLAPEDAAKVPAAPQPKQPYPRIPYHVPDAGQAGEFWIAPAASAAGQQTFSVLIADPKAENGTRSLMDIGLDDLAAIEQAMPKLARNAAIAQREKVTDAYSSRLICVPAAQCPADRQKGQPGQTSIELRFVIYAGGVTAGRLQHNTGAESAPIDFSVEDSLLLRAYLADLVQSVRSGSAAGGKTQEQLDQMFQ